MLLASRIRPFWSSPGSHPCLKPVPATGSLARTSPSSSAATNGSNQCHPLPRKDGNSLPWLFQPRRAHGHLLALPSPLRSGRDAFHLRLGPVRNQFAQTFSQLQLGAEQPLWMQHLVFLEGFAGPCLGCSVLEEAPEHREGLG